MPGAEQRSGNTGTWAIIGLGQIGTSIGLALRCESPGRQVFAGRLVGYDPDARAAAASHAAGAVEELAPSPATAVAGAEMVILAPPAGAVRGLVALLAPLLKPECVLTDVASAKTAIVEAMDQHLGAHGNYVGGHPMAGREQPGPAGASADLFTGRPWVICPGPRTSAVALDRARALAWAVGADPVEMPAADHDRQVAWTSHLPYVASAALALAVGDELGRHPPEHLLAAGGLLDSTRLAASSPRMAGDYCWLNRENLLPALDELTAQLSILKSVLEHAGDVETDLAPLLARAQAWRTSLPARLGRAAGPAGPQARPGGGNRER